MHLCVSLIVSNDSIHTRDVSTTKRYTNPRLPLPYLYLTQEKEKNTNYICYKIEQQEQAITEDIP